MDIAKDWTEEEEEEEEKEEEEEEEEEKKEKEEGEGEQEGGWSCRAFKEMERDKMMWYEEEGNWGSKLTGKGCILSPL
eukprot:365901-Hanusia_phi.AAC.1